jgi:hypothetical protein
MQTFSFPVSDTAEICKKVKELREEGDVYFEVCLQTMRPPRGKRGDAKSKTVLPGIWFDIDVAGPGHASQENYPQSKDDAFAFAIELVPTMIIDTGGGYHLYWLFDSPWVFLDELDRQKGEKAVMYAQQMIREAGIKRGWKFDNTSDLARLMRVPGTYNRKADQMREVRIIHYNPGLLYCPDDFVQPSVEAEAGGYPVLPERPSTREVEYLPSDAEAIIEKCGYMRHCVEDAVSLTEPEWFFFLAILVRCFNGDQLCHQYSEPYPNYSKKETDEKISHVRNMQPATCETIHRDANGQKYCSVCPFYLIIKSPICLGSTDRRDQLDFKAGMLLQRSQVDHGVPFLEENRKLLQELMMDRPQTYMRVRQTLAKLNINVTMLESHIRSQVEQDSPYYSEDSRTYLIKCNGSVFQRKLLANFVATIPEEITQNDGQSNKIHYRIKARNDRGHEFPDIFVASDIFPTMSWVAQNYGADAIIAAGQGVHDHLRAAILFFSREKQKRTVYSHTGWRKIDGQWHYLSANGALGAKGMRNDVEVDLEDSLAGYCLQIQGDNPNPEPVKASLGIFEVVPPDIAIPILAAIYRAPLVEILPADFSLFLVGKTGTFKSVLTGLLLAHFGPGFHGKNLTTGWVSTGNALEKMAFLAKDAIFVIDDFQLGTSQQEANKINQTADRILRGQGNQSGRARMNADSSLKRAYASRSLVVSSGEDLPRGTSLRARMYVVEIKPESVNRDRLTELQDAAAKGKLVEAMSEYIRWLAPKIDDMKETSKDRIIEIRKEVGEKMVTHARAPEMVANLLYGLETFLDFTIQAGVYSEQDAKDLRSKAVQVLIASNQGMTEIQEADDPVKRFGDLLLSAFTTGEAHLEAIQSGQPQEYSRWGWKEMNGPSGQEIKASGKLIGWVCGPDLYLDPEAAFSVVQTIANKQNSPLNITQIILRKRLHSEGVLVKERSSGKLTKRVKIGGLSRKVLHLLTEKMFGEDSGSDTSDNDIPSSTNGGLADGFFPFFTNPKNEPDLVNPFETDNLF